MNTTYDDSSETVKEIRQKLADVVKEADEFVNLVETRIKARENELTEKMRKYEVLKEREKKLDEYKEELEKRERLVKKQKEGLRDKQKALSKKEEQLQQKLERVQNILN